MKPVNMPPVEPKLKVNNTVSKRRNIMRTIRRKQVKKFVSNKEIIKIFLDYIKDNKIPDGVDKTSRSWIEDGVMGENKDYVVSRVAIFQRRKGGNLLSTALYSNNSVYYAVCFSSDYFIVTLKKGCKDRGIKCYDFLDEEGVTGWSEIKCNVDRFLKPLEN